ncbi:unnamed protein product [Aphanomyces euteiches]|uniref:Bifunctional GlmU protein n=1 Tax=Aphanomyces euteiches TaxID=100861 RepID=A0A6G0XL96_9STRA|nr:hypothetical protein Ae201684_003824 [Aphanomyces euteiches]KAH9084739.1 hypothetical protein Ae201684P_001979 [Aphanomyces euteiches]KAH9145807.1 hypothetical protein AeRB84_010315 [Aphanomyces euteiches]
MTEHASVWIQAVCCVLTSCLTLYYVHQLHASRNEESREKDGRRNVAVATTSAPVAKPVKLNTLPLDEVPLVLRPSYYFSHLHEFKHYDLFHHATNVFDVLDNLHAYCEKWLEAYTPEKTSKAKTTIKGGKVGDVSLTCPDPAIASACTLLNYETKKPRRLCLDDGVRIMGGVLDVSEGSIYLGKNVVMEPNVYIKGPAIIGDNTVLRFGTYIRGDVIIGKHCVIRCEIKHALIMDKAELCHPGYCGDSLCGYKSHFANQVSTANLNLLSASTIYVQVNDVVYDTGRRKIGVILGDFSQLGCSVVTDPCTLVGMKTAVYPLTRVNKGFYGPSEIIKNKPMEHGVIERTKLRVAQD